MENKQINAEKMQYIVDCLSNEELLAQLAEEAAELGHAALKLRRVYDGTNATPVPKEDALKSLMEEVADVQLVLETLGLNVNPKYAEIRQAKLDRWVQRLDWGSDD